MTIPLNVLIVEDSEDDTLVLLHTLQSNGYDPIYERVDTAASMNDALERQSWDVVICDYLMPGFGAPAALALLQEKGLDLPFIISSGMINEETAVNALKAGAHDFVLKNRLSRLVPAIEREIREAEIRRKHRQAIDALRQSEARYRSLVIATSQAVWTTNAEGQVVGDNPAWRALTGQSEEALKGWGWLDAIHPEEREQAAQLWFHAVETKTLYEAEHQLETADGTYRFFCARGVPVLDQNGQVREWVGTHTDITARKQAEEERDRLLVREQEARREAETANRIKDEFLAVLSHELRTPLNAILGWSQLLNSRKFDEATVASGLDTIQRNARLQTQLIEDLLDVSRIIRGKISLNVDAVDLASTIQAALETVQLAAKAKSIDFRFSIFDFGLSDVGENLASDEIKLEEKFNNLASHRLSVRGGQNPKFIVLGDSGRLQQVVWNLVSNAVKFTPQGGQVEVRLSVVRCQSPVVSGSEQRTTDNAQLTTDKYAQIQVGDTGKGITPEFLPYVFDYFRQADSSITRIHGGLGLGLAIVRHLVELHGGTIQAESPGEGQGATFTVKLPLIGTPLKTNQDKVQPQNLDLMGIRILVVDDDADTREFLAFLLEQYGAVATVVASASEALAGLVQLKPDILLSDLGMAEIDGYSLIRQIRAMPPEQGGLVPVIALTAYAGETEKQQVLAAGFQKHVAKPVQPTELVAAIANVVRC